MNFRKLLRGLAVATLVVTGGAMLVEGVAVAAEPLAKTLFGGEKLPALGQPRSYGFYSKGCFTGGMAMPVDGPQWQAMRLSRNRRWGHPKMIEVLERLSRDGARVGWNGLLVGDISQPRGGPMLSGHASHQIGLDADIWLTPMPDRRLTSDERENVSARSMLKGDGLLVDEARWTPAHAAVLKTAASYREVERILVHPGIKKKLCETVSGDRSWLGKVRPFWGHDAHFHVRIGCQPGSQGCKEQDAVPPGDGCDKSLDWWFTEEPWRPATGPEKPKARDVMTLASMPNECRAVLAAPSPASEAAVTFRGGSMVGNGAPAPMSAGAAAGFPAAPVPQAEVRREAVPTPTARPGN